MALEELVGLVRGVSDLLFLLPPYQVRRLLVTIWAHRLLDLIELPLLLVVLCIGRF